MYDTWGILVFISEILITLCKQKTHLKPQLISHTYYFKLLMLHLNQLHRGKTEFIQKTKDKNNITCVIFNYLSF